MRAKKQRQRIERKVMPHRGVRSCVRACVRVCGSLRVQEVRGRTRVQAASRPGATDRQATRHPAHTHASAREYLGVLPMGYLGVALSTARASIARAKPKDGTWQYYSVRRTSTPPAAGAPSSPRQGGGY